MYLNEREDLNFFLSLKNILSKISASYVNHIFCLVASQPSSDFPRNQPGASQKSQYFGSLYTCLRETWVSMHWNIGSEILHPVFLLVP